MSLLEESHPAPAPLPPTSDVPPMPSYQLRRDVCGVETELLVQTYDDRVLVIVSQNGKVGCLTQASLPAQISLPAPPPTPSPGSDSALSILSILPPPPPSLNLTTLVGSPPNPTLHGIYAAQIATLVFWALQVSGQARRNVVIGLALRSPPRRADGGDELGGEEESFELDEQERARFAGIMDLVSQWSGPEE